VTSDRRVEMPAGAATGGPFIVGEKLTIYQAAMVYSGRHPGGSFVDGTKDYERASLHDHESYLGKGARDGPRKLAWDIYCQLRRMVAAGEIKPIKTAYTPTGEIDPLDTLIATVDVANLARARGESPECLAPWMNVPPLLPPQKPRTRAKRELAKRLIKDRYVRAPSKQEVADGELQRECLAGRRGVEISRETFGRARDDLLEEQSRSGK
jgi:hypothetical protein